MKQIYGYIEFDYNAETELTKEKMMEQLNKDVAELIKLMIPNTKSGYVQTECSIDEIEESELNEKTPEPAVRVDPNSDVPFPLESVIESSLDTASAGKKVKRGK